VFVASRRRVVGRQSPSEIVIAIRVVVFASHRRVAIHPSVAFE
jgi:hypothetical protein